MGIFVGDNDKNGNANAAGGGGVAYTDVVDSSLFASRYQPAWVNADGVQNRDDWLAAATSHEFGHNLGLGHDGESPGDGEYYDGHGAALLGWGPIMGSGYRSDVTQWTKGEYKGATNTQDDLAVIDTSLRGNVSGSTGYSVDDHGDSRGAATALQLVGNQIVAPTTVDRASDETGANEGYIERNSDVDFWSFTSGSGSIASTAAAFVADNGTSSIDQSPRSSDRQNGTNLDIKMVLYDSSGTALATAAPTDAQAAIIIHSLPCSGTYYLSIEGDGWGDPTGGPTGWTSYGSIGQYFISGTVSVPNDPPTAVRPPPPSPVPLPVPMSSA